MLFHVDPDQITEAKERSKVKYIIFGTVGAVCFIVIVMFISCLAIKRRRHSNISDDDVQPYSVSLPTNESLLENVDTD